MNISISELSTIPTLVFSVWISTLFSADPANVLPEEDKEPTSSENSRKLPTRMPSNGSLRSTEVTFSTEFTASAMFDVNLKTFCLLKNRGTRVH